MTTAFLKLGNESINLALTTRLIELDGKGRVILYGDRVKYKLFEGKTVEEGKEMYDLLMKQLDALDLGDRFKLEVMLP